MTNKIKALLAGIFIIAITFRLIGIQFGLPFEYHPDERWILNHAVLIADGRLNPGWFGTPGSTMMYTGAFALKLMHTSYNMIRDSYPTVLQSYQTDPSLFFLVGRWMTAILGALTVIMVFAIGKRIHVGIGLLAAFFLSFNPLHVEHSHYIHPDITMTFFALGVMYFAFRFWETEQKKFNIFAGVFLGLAVATKYPAAIFGIAYMTTLAWKFFVVDMNRKTNIKKFFITSAFFGLTSIITFLVATPFFIIDFDTVWKNVVYESRSTHAGHGDLGILGHMKYYIETPLHWGIGTLLAIVSWLGMGYLLGNYKKKHIIIPIFFISFFLFIANLNLHWERWIIPAIPFMLLAASSFLIEIYKKLKFSQSKKYLIAGFVVVILISGPAIRAHRITYGMAADDTRTVGLNWALENINPLDTIALEPYTPPIDRYYPNTITSRANEKVELTLQNLGGMSVEQYEEAGVDWLMRSSYIYDRAVNLSDFARQNYGDIEKNTEKIIEFLPHGTYSYDELVRSNDWSVLIRAPFDIRVRRGPEIVIFKLKNTKNQEE